uniref:Bradykinin-potentiating peptide 10 g-AP n=1 Tax=Bitis rhinoceros TaxID=715877 RepID=BPP_BITRH|nr:RecName: Full=Bradykinin-potentiating peptide 10 g-AP; Short=BPP-10 g-AP [Bitis rhinoceros]
APQERGPPEIPP